MKKTALFLAIVLILGTCVVLTSCFVMPGSQTEETTQAESKLSAYDALNDDEKKVYHAMKDFSSTLDNPASLKLINLKKGKTSANDTTKSVFVELSANNAFGSPIKEVYVLTNGRLDNAGSAWYSSAGAYDHYGSVSKINAALQEYFESMGW